MHCIITKKHQIIETHYNKTKKITHGSKIVRAKENLKLSYGWPSQRKISGINKRIKALRQGCHHIVSLRPDPPSCK